MVRHGQIRIVREWEREWREKKTKQKIKRENNRKIGRKLREWGRIFHSMASNPKLRNVPFFPSLFFLFCGIRSHRWTETLANSKICPPIDKSMKIVTFSVYFSFSLFLFPSSASSDAVSRWNRTIRNEKWKREREMEISWKVLSVFNETSKFDSSINSKIQQEHFRFYVFNGICLRLINSVKEIFFMVFQPNIVWIISNYFFRDEKKFNILKKIGEGTLAWAIFRFWIFVKLLAEIWKNKDNGLKEW